MKRILLPFLCFITSFGFGQNELKINDKDYFEMDGLNVIVFSDFYPEGHQSGITIIQHGDRVTGNSDLRLEPSPGQWSPVPKGGEIKIDRENQSITKTLWYPDTAKNRQGVNPVIYPDLTFTYKVNVTALEGSSFKVTVDLDEPLPEEWIGKAGFNFELFPGNLFGKSYLVDNTAGIFPLQSNGPVIIVDDQTLTEPMAKGTTLVIAPEEDLQRITITSKGKELELWDGRANHNNGWFIVRSMIPSGATEKAVEWIITPNVISGWKYDPVIQVSQVGYFPKQEKVAIIELDSKDEIESEFKIYKINKENKELVKTGIPKHWGSFLRYKYATCDFSDVNEEGLYKVQYGDKQSHPFRISDNVYKRDVWQPVMDYFLPVQMCHMRVNEKYRVWHDYCHLDDALMAETDTIHFDGYRQGPSTLTKYKPLDHVPGLDRGGWHDAGDYDLRVESQIGTVWMLALMIEEFGLEYDATLIDQEKRLVEIHVPDGKSDLIQQMEHGLATVLGGYKSLGRLYRGIICNDVRQYVMLGDASSMTDNLVYDASGNTPVKPGIYSGIPDDRWVFTEENPSRELYVAAGLSAASRVLTNENPELAKECLETALALWSDASKKDTTNWAKVIALSELILTTDDADFKKELVSLKDEIIEHMRWCGWSVGHVIHKIDDKKFREDMIVAVSGYQKELEKQQSIDSPYGVPYKPFVWGAGWIIQRFGVSQYFFHKGWPELASPRYYENALNFILGVHPGINNSSFASGIGSKSVTVAYGVNRADWSYIPGGVASGTALIRPDLPELKIWPFFWQQTEYVLGGGSTNYMFLVLAVDKLFNGQKEENNE